MIGLICKSLIRPVSVIHGNNNSLRLKEMDPNSLLQELVFTQMPTNALVCDLDPIKPAAGKKLLARYSWFFENGHPLASKQCDGAIFLSHKNIEYLILIEMKSSAATLPKGRKQLVAGEAFAKYVEALLGRSIKVCTRLIYIGAPAPVVVLTGSFSFPKHKEIAVFCRSGRAYLSLSQLAE